MKKILTMALSLIVSFGFSHSAHAYFFETHALLTKETVEFSNTKSTNDISDELIDYLIDGSRREDDPPRWLNHFYDPIFQRGISYDVAISPLDFFLIPFGDQRMSKDWVESESAQKGFVYQLAAKKSLNPFAIASVLTAEKAANISSLQDDSNFAWNKALRLYINGDKEEAMFALGHVLHLVQDVSVPDHTRNDSHLLGSPYEDFAREFSISNPDNDLESRLGGAKIEKREYLSEEFDSLARTSNENFYSNNTIGIQNGYGLPSPSITELFKGKRYLTNELGGKSFKVAWVDEKKDYFSVNQDQIVVDNDYVLSDYWSLLSVESVKSGASVIDLFFREVDFYKEHPELIQEDNSLPGKIADAVAGFIGKVGDAVSERFNGDGETIPINNGKTIGSPNEGAKEQEESSAPFIFVDKVSVKLGDSILQSGSGFVPETSVLLTAFTPSGKKVSFTKQSDKSGKFENLYSVPMTAEIGVYRLVAKEEISGTETDEVRFEISATKSVKAPSPPKTETKKTTKSEDTKKEEKESDEKKSSPKEIASSSSCSFTGNGFRQGQIIFNEIAWMGTSSSADNEWVEIKNVGDKEVDISGWLFVDKKEDIRFVFPKGTKIRSGGFYLLERTDDLSVSGVRADGIFNGAIGNSDEHLRLIDSACFIQDEVSAPKSWPAGVASPRRPMERKNDLKWQSSSIIDGTPKQNNSSGISSVTPPSSSSSPSYSGGGSATIKATCSQTGLGSPTRSVVINEVAWSGDTEATSNEWIELKNISEETISLHNWELLDKTADIKIVFNSSVSLDSGELLLIERGDKNFIVGKTADVFFSGSINNSDETLRLFDKDCALVDEVVNVGSSWKNIGGSASPSYKTAERKTDLGWQTYQGGDNSGIFGTPKEENSVREETSGLPDETDDDNRMIVISEIMPGKSGNADAEFIELYNPSSEIADLSGISLTRRASASGAVETLVSTDAFVGKSIPPYSFFLIASAEFGESPDATYTQVSYRLSFDGNIVSIRSGSNDIDSVTIGSITAGKSFERKASVSNECVLPFDDNEFLGNGCVLSDGTVERIDPKPQGLVNLSEPREKPTIGFTEDDFSVEYDADFASNVITWPNTEARVYSIFRNDTLLGSYSGERTADKVTRVGVNYNYAIAVADAEGMMSDELTKVISVPGLSVSASIFSGRKKDVNGMTHEGDILRLAWESYPFLPRDAVLRLPHGEPPYPNYKMVVGFISDNPSIPEYVNISETEYAGETALFCYSSSAGSDCVKNLILPDAPDLWVDGAPNGNALDWNKYLADGDDSIFIPLGTDVPEGRNLILAYYGFAHGIHPGEIDNPGDMRLIGYDLSPVLRASPALIAPSVPTDLAAVMGIIDTEAIITFDPSTDGDSPDWMIGYEISLDDGVSWNPIVSGGKISVSPDNSYSISVRAIDDFGTGGEASVISFTATAREVDSPSLFGAYESVAFGHHIGQRVGHIDLPSVSSIGLRIAPGSIGSGSAIICEWGVDMCSGDFRRTFSEEDVNKEDTYFFSGEFAIDSEKEYVVLLFPNDISPVAFGSDFDSDPDGYVIRELKGADPTLSGPIVDLYVELH